MNIKGPYCDPQIKYSQKKSLKQNINKSLVSSGKGTEQKSNSLNNEQQKNLLLLSSRSSTILPEFIGLSFAVYNGKEYKTFGRITPDHVGKKFGEFASTKKPAIYKKRK